MEEGLKGRERKNTNEGKWLLEPEKKVSEKEEQEEVKKVDKLRKRIKCEFHQPTKDCHHHLGKKRRG